MGLVIWVLAGLIPAVGLVIHEADSKKSFGQNALVVGFALVWAVLSFNGFIDTTSHV